jgi:alpha-galactosidase
MTSPTSPPFDRWEPSRLGLQLSGGRLDLRAVGPARVQIRGATMGLVVRRRGARMAWQIDAFRPDGLGAGWDETGIHVELRSSEVDGALILNTALEHRGDEPVSLEEAAPLLVTEPGDLAVGAAVQRWAIFRNGYQSWSGTRVYGVGERDRDPRCALLRETHVDVRHPARGPAGMIRSDLVTAIVERDGGDALALGFLDARDFFPAIAVDARGGRFRSLAAVLDGDGLPLVPGQRLELPPLWLAAGTDGDALLAAWAAAAGRHMGARVAARSPSGWCSWYYYFGRVTERDIVAAAESLKAVRERVPCEYVMVDDGYQGAVGDWLRPNRKFPHGMRWVAQRIRTSGFEAGIWIAPFLVRPDAELFRARPEWILRTARGRPRRAAWNPGWGVWRPAYALDTTHPGVLEWLAELARTIVHQWGYRFLKLGCGCPLGPAVGIVDAMRIGPDVAPRWSTWVSRGLLRDRHGVSTKHAVRNILTRAFMHRRLWLNDPDCVLVRERDSRLTAEEVQTLAAAVALSDGVFALGDRVEALPEARLAILEQIQQLRGGSLQLVDLFDGDPPTLARAEYPEGDVIGIFNFRERPIERRVEIEAPVAGDTVRELWSAVEVPIRDRHVAVGPIPPHGCRLLWCEPPPTTAEGRAPE